MTVVVGNAANARYWRINITAEQNSSYCTIGEIYFYDITGADLTVGGTASSSPAYQGVYVAANAFDKSVTTKWIGAPPDPHFIAYDFGKVVAARSVKIVYPSGYSTTSEAPKNYTIECSQDGVNWAVVATVTNDAPWSYGESRIIPLGAYKVSGTAKLDNGSRASMVYVFNWSTGVAIGSTVPATDGTFSVSVPYTDVVAITVVGPAGYQPVTHGPVQPVDNA